MPNTKSAAKRLRSGSNSCLRNRMRKSRVKTMEARLAQCLAAGDATAAQAALHKCFSELDRAANAGAFHPNRASRKKGRLAARVAALR